MRVDVDRLARRLHRADVCGELTRYPRYIYCGNDITLAIDILGHSGGVTSLIRADRIAHVVSEFLAHPQDTVLVNGEVSTAK